MPKFAIAKAAKDPYYRSAVQEARDKHHWTQAELAQRVGISRTALGLIEIGRHAKPLTAQAIADALGVDVDKLFEPAE